ncbi:hydroxyacid dehydrogenase [Rhodobacteraceae bacterium RKSG542]|uniref:hydroxyacid dehydrogenase n=1 Tax=Pseudovibrio flavus TaxID=2529854 RepID=UPI0012BD0548|nr:hydroxyacid dehydrogenase [Pseudovibrio flavus]MTI18158.1 hydroxyacid dehydrogenase [Pseudovibrio flavus]
MKKLVVYGGLESTATALLQERSDIQSVYVQQFDLETLAKEIADAQALVLRYLPFPNEVLSQGKNLKIIARTGVGCDNIDVAAATEAGVPVIVTGNVTSRAVAEHALTLLLSAAKQIKSYDAAVRVHNFNHREAIDSMELDGRDMLIVGFGRIGGRMAELCTALGMKVTVYDPFVDAAHVEKAGYILERDLDNALSNADALSIHAPKGPEDGYLLSGERIQKLKPGAIIINTARGALIDEKALDEAIREGHVFAAGVDVYSSEPPKSDNPLLENERMILTPHCAAQTKQAMARMCYGATINALNYLDGCHDASLIVNPKALEA